MNRAELLSRLNNSGLSQQLSSIQTALLLGAAKALTGSQQEEKEETAADKLKFLLNCVGPAAASAAVDYALTKTGHKYKSTTTSRLNGNYVNNVEILCNDEVGELPGFGNVLREFLLPRYAYLDFDMIVDPRHRLDVECGYPKFITPIMYRYMYDRDDMARRVVDIYPDEAWAATLDVYETEDEDDWTPFELRWRELCDNYNLIQYLYRLDRQAGIGHYGVLLLGLDDGKDLEAPVDEAALLAGLRGSVSTRQRNLLYMRPFDEYLSFIHMYETDVLSPRYGLPKFYNLVFLDMTIDAAGASIGTRLNRRVHWSRVIHVAEDLQSSLVFGCPRMQPVFNRLLDLRKVKGSSAEMFWKGGFPGLSFEVDPRFVADEPDFDKDEFERKIRDYENGLTRVLALMGVKVNSLSPQVADPKAHVDIQIQAIASHKGVPLRVFVGAEEGRLASSQDKLTWNIRLRRRNTMFTTPYIVRAVIDRFVALGLMPPPSSGKYYVDWDDLNTATDEDKANLALKWTQAISQYVASGAIHFMSPMDFCTMILGLGVGEARKVVDYIERTGGLAKLQKVDPSQGAGVNGKREGSASSEKSENQGGDAQRDSGDKKAEGMKGK